MSTILSLDSVSKNFNGIKAVNNLSIDFEENGLYGLIGPNGAGKTTTFNMITGALNPTSGSIKFKGTDITALPSHRINRMGIGRTFQTVQPFDEMTVTENIRVGAHFNHPSGDVDSVVDESLEKVGLMDIADRLAGELTIGQLKRLEIGRAISTDPELLLLDEPTSGLTPTESNEIVTLFDELLASIGTIILIEHDMNVIMNISEHIYVLNKGTLIAEGSPDEVSNDEKVIEAYLGASQRG